MNYLVMALHYSPWQPETEAIQQAWPMQDFPPGFPLLLAATGAAHSFIYAHIVVVALGLASLYLVYRFSMAVMADRTASKVAVVILAICPGYLLGLQDILSESMYLLLSVLFLSQYSESPPVTRERVMLLGILLAAVMLTRTAGFVLLVALLCQAATGRVAHARSAGAPIGIVMIGLLVFALVMALAGPERETHYLGTLGDVMAGRDSTGIGTGWNALAGQALTFIGSWRTFFIVYWLADLAFNSLVTLALLVVSVIVLGIRLRSNQLDAWYVFGSILLLLIWPHPGQMLRLIFPIMPILIVYMVQGIFVATRNLKKRQTIRLLAGFVMAALILPAHAFIFGRLEVAAERGLVPVYELFRRPDLEAGLDDLFIQNQMMADFARLESSLSLEDRVLYFEPAYVAILGKRIGLSAPAPVEANAYRALARASGATHIFVTAMHPRQTRAGIDGLSGVRSLDGWTEMVWCSDSRRASEHVSCLFALRAEKE